MADARDYTRLYEGCFEHLLCCAISLATDSYFEEKSKVYGWSAADEEDVRSAWYNLVAKAFTPEATENDLKQDDQKHDLYETWQERFARQMEAESMTVEEIEAAIRRHKANR